MRFDKYRMFSLSTSPNSSLNFLTKKTALGGTRTRKAISSPLRWFLWWYS